MGNKGIAYRVSVEGKRPLGRPRFRWEDNVHIDLREIGWYGGMGQIHLSQVRTGGWLLLTGL
jgi:hypothetical protein